MLHTLKRARRIGLTVHFPYSLPLKMVARIRKYAEICRNWLPVTSHARPLSLVLTLGNPGGFAIEACPGGVEKYAFHL